MKFPIKDFSSKCDQNNIQEKTSFFVQWMILFINILNYCNIFIRNGKIGWKRGVYCWYFCLNLKYLGWPYKECIKRAKSGGFCQELLSETNFEAVLATFCCYEYGANASEAVQNIARDQKELLVCSNFMSSWNITINQ